MRFLLLTFMALTLIAIAGCNISTPRITATPTNEAQAIATATPLAEPTATPVSFTATSIASALATRHSFTSPYACCNRHRRVADGNAALL